MYDKYGNRRKNSYVPSPKITSPRDIKDYKDM